ncbi:YafY family protein [Nereida sp. MMG025]|uniref:helix-turn-helix transcriptional regulator n=1 Tax=Nereida sp. MMG025 TaxID=2909981 RepID=UPI001F21999D|nr:YafY family protein [Nereida sp. MMG025]MCF6445445.1 YafY family transcriptional regulator [Nereida sp. MMG025]
MRRADRLFQIVQHLRTNAQSGGRLTTAQDLADTLEVSPRTIYRDIADLVGSGVPIDGEAGLGYMMRDGYDLPPLMFTTSEITALVAGARILQAFGGADMARAAQDALDKINTVLPDDARAQADATVIHSIAAGPAQNQLAVKLDDLGAATQQTQRLQLDYRDQHGVITQRIVRPLGLWFWGNVWTLVTWCELRQDFRTFRCDRIRSFENLGAYTPIAGQTLSDFYGRDDGYFERSSQAPVRSI